MTITGNVGEWSEIYTLFKVLGDQTLFAGNESLEKLEDVIYPVLKVLRTESTGSFEYAIDKEVVFVTSEGTPLLRLPVKEFAEKAEDTLTKIKEQKNKKGTFSIPEIEKFMTSIHCKSLKAAASAKTDITIVIHDEKTNHQPSLGFSIKSQLGSASTLLNAGKTTNLKYAVTGINADQISEINSFNGKKKVRERVRKIYAFGGGLEFKKADNDIFNNNLVLIDTSLPNIVGKILLDFYTTENKTVKALVGSLEKDNPLNYDCSSDHPFYSYKIKRMLTDMALGLTPCKVWDGQNDATGGYLVVKDDGDVLCYHLYNKNKFEDYLFANTKLETASTSRHDFAKIYKEGGDHYIKLNLQIRFLK